MDDDTDRLVRYLTRVGATRGDLDEAAENGSLGALALELALRGPGELVAFQEAAARAGLELGEAAAMWRALGFPDPLSSPTTLWPSQVDALCVLAELGRTGLGSETTLQLARVIGGCVSLLAEAMVDAFRTKVELPRRMAGEPYSEVVEDYVRAAPLQLSALNRALGDLLRSHVVGVSRSRWAPDVSQATVTRERTVGFADLVGYTSNTRLLSPPDLADAISSFESHVGDAVSSRGGRVVKLIGDEAMFVVEEGQAACELALELTRALEADARLPAVRIGIAAGPVLSHHGDYYGEVVNLAARLVKAAEPGEVLVSESIACELSDAIGREAVRTPPMKGFEQGVPAFRLCRPGTREPER